MQDKQYIGVEPVNTILVSVWGFIGRLCTHLLEVFFLLLSVLNSVFLQLNELLQKMLKKAKCILFTLF